MQTDQAPSLSNYEILRRLSHRHPKHQCPRAAHQSSLERGLPLTKG